MESQPMDSAGAPSSTALKLIPYFVWKENIFAWDVASVPWMKPIDLSDKAGLARATPLQQLLSEVRGNARPFRRPPVESSQWMETIKNTKETVQAESKWKGKGYTVDVDDVLTDFPDDLSHPVRDQERWKGSLIKKPTRKVLTRARFLETGGFLVQSSQLGEAAATLEDKALTIRNWFEPSTPLENEVYDDLEKQSKLKDPQKRREANFKLTARLVSMTQELYTERGPSDVQVSTWIDKFYEATPLIPSPSDTKYATETSNPEHYVVFRLTTFGPEQHRTILESDGTGPGQEAIIKAVKAQVGEDTSGRAIESSRKDFTQVTKLVNQVVQDLCRTPIASGYTLYVKDPVWRKEEEASTQEWF